MLASNARALINHHIPLCAHAGLPWLDEARASSRVPRRNGTKGYRSALYGSCAHNQLRRRDVAWLCCFPLAQTLEDKSLPSHATACITHAMSESPYGVSSSELVASGWSPYINNLTRSHAA